MMGITSWIYNYTVLCDSNVLKVLTILFFVSNVFHQLIELHDAHLGTIYRLIFSSKSLNHNVYLE